MFRKIRFTKHVITFVMPTGYSFNLDGSTLYSSLAVIFLAQMYNIDFGLTQQIMMLLTLMISTKGIAGCSWRFYHCNCWYSCFFWYSNRRYRYYLRCRPYHGYGSYILQYILVTVLLQLLLVSGNVKFLAEK